MKNFLIFLEVFFFTDEGKVSVDSVLAIIGAIAGAIIGVGVFGGVGLVLGAIIGFFIGGIVIKTIFGILRDMIK